MFVRCVEKLEDFPCSFTQWDELAGGCVFRSWIWLSTWWRHYGTSDSGVVKKLQLLLVFDENKSSSCEYTDRATGCSSTAERLVAILPCYLEKSVTRGRILRLLGDGEVCSDHLDLLVHTDDCEQAAQTLADYLLERADTWDLATFSNVEAQSPQSGLGHLATALAKQDCCVSREPDQHCWSINLPDSWEAFLAEQSKSHRKQLRRLDNRVLDSSRSAWNLVSTPEDFDRAWDILQDLHQRRRQSLGETGCFASPRWAAFHREVAQQLLADGRLRMSWLALDGEPVAAEYHFADGNTTYAYQGGLDPDRLDQEPGRLSMICTLQYAIEQRCEAFDLLRGDEAYKAHWRATPTETFQLQIVPNRSSAQLRYHAWSSLRNAARWVRQIANLLS